jgi:outer membrane protein assembly factor BamB
MVPCHPDSDEPPEQKASGKEKFHMRRRSCVFVVSIAALLTEAIAIPDAANAQTATARTTASSPKATEGDWPGWRGPTLDGKSRDEQVVTKWSRAENVLWKAKVPGRGHSSPIVCSQRVFLTTANEDAHKQYVLAFDRKTGKPLWSTLAHEAEFTRKNPKNSYASATPACDGQRVYSVFLNRDGLHVTATNLDGKILWQTRAGAFQSQHGYGCSPVLFKSLVIINGDSLKDCFVAALDRKSGEVVWRTTRKTTGKNGSYATPIVAQLAGRPQLILTGMGEVSSYDPETGKLIWSCAGPSEVTGCTAACSDKLVFATGGYPEKEILAIRADGAGDVTKSHIVWRSGKGVAYVPSPLYHEGYLYVVADGAMVSCFKAATGEPVWQERLQGAFTSSPVLIRDLLYVTNEAGKTFVLKTGPKFEVVAANTLEEGVLATLAVSGGRLFLRASGHLYCIGRGDPKPFPGLTSK